MIHLGVDKQPSIILWNTAIGRQKRHGPLWIDLVGFSRGYLCERTWQSSDWWELRVSLRPVAVKEVKVDVGAGGLKLCRVDREQDKLCVAIAEGDNEEAIQKGTSCDDEEAESQECLDPIAYGYYHHSRRYSDILSTGRSR